MSILKNKNQSCFDETNKIDLLEALISYNYQNYKDKDNHLLLNEAIKEKIYFLDKKLNLNSNEFELSLEDFRKMRKYPFKLDLIKEEDFNEILVYFYFNIKNNLEHQELNDEEIVFILKNIEKKIK